MKGAAWLATVCVMLMAWADISHGQQCDCQKVIGSCQGAVEFVRSYGSKPSFGAELIIHSSERQCSKVEYYVNNTPYQTVLVNRNAEPESIFGTSRIQEKDVSYTRCSVCASSENASQTPQPSQSSQSPATRFQGTWAGTGTNSFFLSRQRILHIDVTGPNSANVQLDLGGEMIPGTGEIHGYVMSIRLSRGITATATLTGQNELRYEASGMGTVTATMTRQ
ncbi:hypothetical protein [Pandoraea apista]|uniref:hypothetical protein n=1 Tax=Pandoraea apista TaxID=93218 RepID=UPI00065A32FC|nr:hypothetical protein [Pandoraea apista]CFB65365.1 hypothetical protein LMG16407_04834 [Pandoraea apista]